MKAKNRFVILNMEGELVDAESWNDPAREKLWLYNLHYFDDLNATGATGRVAQAAEMGLNNVCFVSRQAKEDMPGIWSLCDISLIQLKDDPLFKSVIPSKIFESMGMGLPIILSLPKGEASGIIQNSGAGVAIPPEQPQVLAETVLRLFQNRDELDGLAKASLAAAPGHSREKQARKMLETLKRVA